MMTYSVEIQVMPLKDLLDPQGKAVLGSLGHLGIQSVTDVRVGKNILLKIDASSAEEALQLAEIAAQKLLANPVMEQFSVKVLP